jgi:hypothetical protein
MVNALQLKPYDKGIHIRFAPSKAQLLQATNIAKEFALSIVK